MDRRTVQNTLLAAALFTPLSVFAQETGQPESIAFLFAYTPHEGQGTLFDEGYRRHLEWHRSRQDPLVWYGWYVVTGPRAGMFVDGTFGAPFAAIDARVEPGADAADFVQTTGPHGSIEYRTAYVLRRDLSISTPLEDRQPPGSQQVYRYRVQPGMVAAFEAGMVRLSERLGNGEADWTCYEAIDGDRLPGYLIVVPRDGFSNYAAARGDLLSHARRHLTDDETLRQEFEAAISSLDSETWRYRPDLSYLP
jgi:hypothetical protein